MSEHLISLRLNGQPVALYVPIHWTLLEVLRYRLGLTGTKQGCDQGDCGACTVLMNGKPVLACLTLAGEADECQILTIEGLAKPDRLHPVQSAFDAAGALQCGFCQSGMMLSAASLLETTPSPSDEDIERALEGNLCRCTGYTKIRQAIRDAASARSDEPAK